MTGTSTSARTLSWLMHRKKMKILSIWKSVRSLSPLSSITGLQDKEKIIDSDLMFSPAQVTEHHHVELKDQKDRIVKLKQQYPDVFLLSSQDIGHTNLVTMHVYMGDSPPICQKPYTLPLKHYSWVQDEINTLEHAGVIRKSINPWAHLLCT